MGTVVWKKDIDSAVYTEALVDAPSYIGPLDFWKAHDGLKIHRMDDLDTLLISKLSPGFDRECVDNLSLLLRKVSEGGLPRLKYLVFDFAHQGEQVAEAADGFDELASANARLILDAPVISIAWARSYLADADLDFALSCSMMVADRSARFNFDADLTSAVGVYGALAQKLGFVKAERLMEGGEILTAEQMHELRLVKHIIEKDEGIGGAESYVRQCGRRYNASYSMFRAQRISVPPIRRPILNSAVGRRG
ncbi:MAG: enoyl-CoA hydratase [Methylocystaceae bacterium]|nr:MAG: enoyl-CoA hydratase [Methylocystaceae bacterium]